MKHQETRRVGMLTNLAYHRRDITEGRAGLPLALTVTIVNFSSTVYLTGVYDNVFSDGVNDQLAQVSGTTTSGYIATITFGVNA